MVLIMGRFKCAVCFRRVRWHAPRSRKLHAKHRQVIEGSIGLAGISHIKEFNQVILAIVSRILGAVNEENQLEFRRSQVGA